MDIGSAKIDPASCANVPHHLLNVVDVTQSFNAGEYYKLAVNAIEVKGGCKVWNKDDGVCLYFSPFFPEAMFLWSWGVLGSMSGHCSRGQLVLLPPLQSPWSG